MNEGKKNLVYVLYATTVNKNDEIHTYFIWWSKVMQSLTSLYAFAKFQALSFFPNTYQLFDDT